MLLIPRDAADDRSAILEVRAGTGGDEAALFAGELFRMYERYAALHGWKIEVLSASDGEVGGYREIISIVRGAGVYARLKFESGVHRVQRVPTDGGERPHPHLGGDGGGAAGGRRTSTSRSSRRICAIDTTRASSSGGQHANTTEIGGAHACTSRPGSSSPRARNRSTRTAPALCRCCARASSTWSGRSRRTAALAERKGQVGSGDRSERIRTYNFPQGRVTDHRINLTLYKLDKVLDGEALDEVVDALIADDQARKLSEFEDSAA